MGNIKRLERSKTPEELRVLDIANRGTNILLTHYGATPFDIPLDNTAIIPANKLLIPEDEIEVGGIAERTTVGTYDQLCQSTYVYEQPGLTPLAHNVVHEMIHAKSRQNPHVNNRVLDKRRDGLELNRARHKKEKRNGVYFRWLNEAVTEELALRFTQAFRTMSIGTAEDAETKRLLAEYPAEDGIDPDEIVYATTKTIPVGPSWLRWLKRQSSETEAKPRYVMAAYKDERKRLNLLIDALYANNPDQFPDRQAVFDVFARAMLADNLLPLGRLIERTFGRGSFERYGHPRTDPKGLEEEWRNAIANPRKNRPIPGQSPT